MKFLINLQNLNVRVKKIIISIFDLLLFNISFWISYNLRDVIFLYPNENQLLHLIIGNLLFILLYFYFKIYNYLLRFFDIGYIRIFIKFIIYFFVVYFITTFLIDLNTVQRSSPITISITCLSLIIVSRFSLFTLLNYSKSKNKINIALIGSGNLALNFFNSVKNGSLYNIKFFFSDNEDLVGRKISTVEIKDLKNILSLVKKNNIKKIIIASNKIDTNKIRKTISELKKNNILIDYFNNNILIPHNTNYNSTENPLTSRDIDFFHNQNSKVFNRSDILITGAGGSIGSELTRQLLRYNPKKIILYEISEINLFNINSDLERLKTSETEVISILGDITNNQLLKKVFEKYQPDIVFHAAAIKHVKIAEENVETCVFTNVIGTKNLLDQALSSKKTKRFILISTDKAVSPENVMGLTKRCAEILMMAYQIKSNNKCFNAVRFGNVANSSGSVFPIWRKQIFSSEKLTITDPEATRYLMSITEAVNLVLDASIIGKGGEIYVLDMGEPYKIIDLAKKFLSNYGLDLKDKNNENGVEYSVLGLRKGEKKHEKLFHNDSFIRTINNHIFDSKETLKKEMLVIEKFLSDLNTALSSDDTKKLINLLKKFSY